MKQIIHTNTSPNHHHHEKDSTNKKPEMIEYVQGLVFTHALPHKKMRTKIPLAKVLLADIELEDEERQVAQYTTINAQTQTPYAKIIHLYEKQTKFDVILTTKRVSRRAIEGFMAIGVTVISQCKPRNIERLSKLFDAEILTDINGENMVVKRTRQWS